MLPTESSWVPNTFDAVRGHLRTETKQASSREAAFVRESVLGLRCPIKAGVLLTAENEMTEC